MVTLAASQVSLSLCVEAKSVLGGGGGGYLRNLWVGMCRWDPGPLIPYPRVNCLKTIPFTAAQQRLIASRLSLLIYMSPMHDPYSTPAPPDLVLLLTR